MQARRQVRARPNAENGDENRAAGNTRLTRAKAASISTGAGAALAPKTANPTTNIAPANRKRAVLGDVSNVHKIDGNGVADKKVVKKVSTKTAGVATKAKTTVKSTTRAAASKTAKVEPKERSKKRPAQKEEEDEEEAEEEESAPKVEAKAAKVEANLRATKKPRMSETMAASAVTGWKDLDAEDHDDPLMVSEYVNEIFEYLRQIEVDSQPNPKYMDDQDDLQWQMRDILIDWLIEVHTRFRLLPETLFLAVNIVDRFLSNKSVPLEKLQLVGVTAMFIAAKYEEVYAPHVQYFSHVAADGFDEEDILGAERAVLNTLDYSLSYPNPLNFLRRISKADQYDLQTRTFAKYFMEMSLLDHRFLPYLPSHVAAAAMYLSRLILSRGEWDADLIHYSDYTEEQIQPVFHLMVDYLRKPVKHEAFHRKYQSKRFMKVSTLARKWAKEVTKAQDPKEPIVDESS
ncbi:G2/mitotic-specific cyclin CYB1 [Geopyxis carbonaria]|nr:G2/mitotic-specific cyclin CYB1 [Geopyxis carbonaria]